jgi:hypothetical protein
VPKRQLALNLDYAHPIKEDVKKKDFSPPPRRDAGVVTYIQPSHSRKGDWFGRFGWPQIYYFD